MHKSLEAQGVYVLDCDAFHDFDDWIEKWGGLVETDSAPRVHGVPLQIWQPPIRRPEAIEDWLEQLSKEEDIIVLINEIFHVIYGRQFSEQFQRLQKLGRKRGICLLSLGQSFSRIPQEVIGQATHLVKFGLETQYDETQSRRLLRVQPYHRHKWSFWYRNLKANQPGYYYRDAKEFYGER